MSTPLLESDLLRTFVAIAESGSFTRSARIVHRSTAAVSMQVRRLETLLGCALFLREPRQARLTADGERLLGYARRMLALNAETVAQFSQHRVTGRVRFGTPFDVGNGILPDVLGAFARDYPEVEVEVCVGRSAELIARLDADELDLTLINSGNDGVDDGRGELIHAEALVWAGLDGGRAAQRTPLPLALASSGCAWRRAGTSALERHGRDYRIAYSSEQSAGQEAAVKADLAIAVLPRSLVRPPLRQLGAEQGLPELGQFQVRLLCTSQTTPAVSAIAEHLRRTCA